jgi:hypothetical protein
MNLRFYMILVYFSYAFSGISTIGATEEEESGLRRQCAQLCKLSYLDLSAFDLPTIKSVLSGSSWQAVVHDCRSPLGAIAVVSSPQILSKVDQKPSQATTYRTLAIAFRGTDIEANPSSGVIDLGFACACESKDDLKKFIKGVRKTTELTTVHSSCLFLAETLPDLLDLSPMGEEIVGNAVFSALGFARRSIAEYKKRYTSEMKVMITGHSLGGIYAQCIGYYLSFPTVTFNAPGARGILDTSMNVLAQLDHDPVPTERMGKSPIENLTLGDDMIGNFGTVVGTRLAIPYNAEEDSKLQENIRLKCSECDKKIRRELSEILSRNIEELGKKRDACEKLIAKLEREGHKGTLLSFFDSPELSKAVAQHDSIKLVIDEYEKAMSLKKLPKVSEGGIESLLLHYRVGGGKIKELRGELQKLLTDISHMKFLRKHSIDAICDSQI